MQISRRSWHYWMYDKFSDELSDSTNLCHYVKTILLGILATILVVCLVGICAISVGWMLYAATVLAVHYLHWYALLILAGIILVVWLIRRSTHDLVSEYIQAKKDRYCPTVKFTE